MLPKNSAIGPSARAGKKLSAPTRSTIKISRNTNIAFVEENVPAVTAFFFLFARLPAISSVQIIGRNRAISMTIPIVTFRNIVFALNPANADPLLPPPELYA